MFIAMFDEINSQEVSVRLSPGVLMWTIKVLESAGLDWRICSVFAALVGWESAGLYKYSNVLRDLFLLN